MSRNIIFFDCDGVLLDMYTPFCKEFMPGITPEMFKDYNISLYPPFNGDRQKMSEAFAKFIETPAHAQLEPMVTMMALEAVASMGYELQVITQSNGSTKARANRVWNLVNRFGKVFSGVHFTVAGQSKIEYIKNWADEELQDGDKIVALVEDRPDTIKECAEYPLRYRSNSAMAQMKAVGIKHTYNQQSWTLPRTYWFAGADSFCFALVCQTIDDQDSLYLG